MITNNIFFSFQSDKWQLGQNFFRLPTKPLSPSIESQAAGSKRTDEPTSSAFERTSSNSSRNNQTGPVRVPLISQDANTTFGNSKSNGVFRVWSTNPSFSITQFYHRESSNSKSPSVRQASGQSHFGSSQSPLIGRRATESLLVDNKSIKDPQMILDINGGKFRNLTKKITIGTTPPKIITGFNETEVKLNILDFTSAVGQKEPTVRTENLTTVFVVNSALISTTTTEQTTKKIPTVQSYSVNSTGVVNESRITRGLLIKTMKEIESSSQSSHIMFDSNNSGMRFKPDVTQISRHADSDLETKKIKIHSTTQEEKIRIRSIPNVSHRIQLPFNLSARVIESNYPNEVPTKESNSTIIPLHLRRRLDDDIGNSFRLLVANKSVVDIYHEKVDETPRVQQEIHTQIQPISRNSTENGGDDIQLGLPLPSTSKLENVRSSTNPTAPDIGRYSLDEDKRSLIVATRSCDIFADGTARWSAPSVDQCQSAAKSDAENAASDIAQLTSKPSAMNQAQFTEAVKELSALVEFAARDEQAGIHICPIYY